MNESAYEIFCEILKEVVNERGCKWKYVSRNESRNEDRWGDKIVGLFVEKLKFQTELSKSDN